MDDLGLDMGGSDSPESEWDRLSSEDRKELLKAVFADSEWYDGPAYHEGGAYHPAIGEIASKLGCRSDDIKMYYAAWLQAKGFTKELELVGVGYRATNQGQKLDLALGFSHNILFDIAPEVKVETVSEKGKNPIVKLSSHDKQLLGYVAAKIRSFRKPEPYKGKGVKFVGEQIRRKAGKSA